MISRMTIPILPKTVLFCLSPSPPTHHNEFLVVQHTPLMGWLLRSCIGGKWGAPMGKQPPESWKYIYQVSPFLGKRNYQESAWEAVTNTVRRLELLAKAHYVTADRLLVPKDLSLLVRDALGCEGGEKWGKTHLKVQTSHLSLPCHAVARMPKPWVFLLFPGAYHI